MAGKTDEEAVAALSAGDNGAFRTLYDRYAARGRSYAISILRNEADSEEAVQEAFYRLLKPVYSGAVDSKRGGFCNLFFATVRNLCIDRLRKPQPMDCRDIEQKADAAAHPGRMAEKEADSAREASRLATRVREALEELPSHQAEALKLRLNGELTYEQIAGILGCTRPQVRTWIYRARRRLEEKFRREGLLDGRI